MVVVRPLSSAGGGGRSVASRRILSGVRIRGAGSD
jgi:hypothetical protein